MAKSCKYYKQQRQVSYDNGVTWIPLDEYQKGALIEVNSSDCTSPSPKIYRWTQTEDTVCVENLSSTYTKYYVYKKQESTDNGSTWNDVYPTETKPDGSPIGTYDTLEECEGLFKFRATYLGGSEYELPCDGNTTLTRGETNTYSAMTTGEIGLCVSTLDKNVFMSFTELTSVSIPNSVTTIGENAFSNCRSLPSITIPNSVSAIGSGGVYYCDSLTSVTFEEGSQLSSISDLCFSYCKINSINIPSSVTSIGNQAFEYCTSLTSATIPSGVTSIGQSAFQGCSGLTSVELPSGITSIEDSTFRFCKSLSSVTIPDSVTSIGIWAFQTCNSLITVTLPPRLTSIGRYAFNYCTSLTQVICLSTTPPSLETGVFNNTTCQILVPASSLNAYKTASGWSNYADRIQAIP